MNLKLFTFPLFLLIYNFVFAQQILVLPEPTKIYTCGESYQPVDLVFDGEGNLYSTDAQLLIGGGLFQYIQTQLNTVQLANYLYSHNALECQIVLETGPYQLFGLTETPSGEVCFGRNEGGGISEPIHSNIYCIDTSENIKLVSFGSTISPNLTDITFYDSKFILSSIFDTPTEEMPTLISSLSYLKEAPDLVELETISETVNFIYIRTYAKPI